MQAEISRLKELQTEGSNRVSTELAQTLDILRGCGLGISSEI